MSGADRNGLEIAVVGLAGRFPGARDVEELWRNLCDGVESIARFSDEELLAEGFSAEFLALPNLVKAGGALAGIDLFDAAFFGISPREAEVTDPQHRLFLECAWEALEDAGCDPETWPGAIGVFAGGGVSSYLLFNLAPRRDLLAALGTEALVLGNRLDNLTTRAAYKLNLRGPAVTVQTSCSTSLVAVHFACQSLLNGECDLALAGGISVAVPAKLPYLYHEGGLLSPDGHCRAFDERAAGTVAGSGVGIVVLKRLDDALADSDAVRAVIRGSAVNNDGSLRLGYTAPGVDGQAQVLKAALTVAEVDPRTVGFIEAHGSGTRVGDPIEVAALLEAYGAAGEGRPRCALGSIKTNIGHLDAAAGVAGLIKAILALERGVIPPTLHFERPNPGIDFERAPFFVNTSVLEWRSGDQPRRAAVSSFGLGGTNAHLILEEAPAPPPDAPAREWHLLTLSAGSAAALERATENLLAQLCRGGTPLADAAFTLQTGRRRMSHRRVLVCRDAEDAAAVLTARDPWRLATGASRGAEPRVVFLFPGLGEQYAGMGRHLYRDEPAFRDAIDLCGEILRPEIGEDLRAVLFPEEESSRERWPGRGEAAAGPLDDVRIGHPAVFAVSWALTRLWHEWGVHPQALFGHSLGEYVAACVAGTLALEEALRLVARRARLVSSLPRGAMLAVPLSEVETEARLGKELSLAAVNAPEVCVVAGPEDAVSALARELMSEGQVCQRIRVAQAFHSRELEPAAREMEKLAADARLRPPEIPFLSNVTGEWITAAEATDPAYWSRHLVSTVRFEAGLRNLLASGEDLLLVEAGPGQSLSSFVWQHADRGPGHLAVPSLPSAHDPLPESAVLLTGLGKVWLAGGVVDWSGFHAHAPRRRVPLPTYPFERRRFWIDREPAAVTANPRMPPVPVEHPAEQSTGHPPRTAAERTIAAVFRDLLGTEELGIHDSFFELGGSSMLAVRLAARLRDELGFEMPPHLLLEAPTVAALAERIGRSATLESPEEPRCLIEIQRGRGAPPLFLFHPVGGHVLFYRGLAQVLGPEQPVYGLQALGLNDGETALETIQEMAAVYIPELRRVQPSGPYRLGGSSMGGTIAYEVAHQLRAAGEQVAGVALLDTPGPTQMPVELSDDAAILLYLVGGIVPVTRDEIAALDREQQIRYLLERVRDANALPPDMDLPQAYRLLSVFKANSKAMAAYDPRPLAVPISYFRARERRPEDPTHPERAWVDLAEAGINIRIVPGNHITMHHPPHLQKLGKSLRECLAGATAAAGDPA